MGSTRAIWIQENLSQDLLMMSQKIYLYICMYENKAIHIYTNLSLRITQFYFF